MKKNINFSYWTLFLLVNALLVPNGQVSASESTHKSQLTLAAITAVVGVGALAYRACSYRRDASKRIELVTSTFKDDMPELKYLIEVNSDGNRIYRTANKIAHDYHQGLLQISSRIAPKYKKLFLCNSAQNRDDVDDQSDLPAARMHIIGNYQEGCIDRFVGLINRDYKAPTEPSKFDGIPVFDEPPRFDGVPIFDCSPAPSWLDVPVLFDFQRKKLRDQLDPEALEVSEEEKEKSEEEEEYNVFTALRCTTKLTAVLGWSLPKYVTSLGWSCAKYIGSLGFSSTKYLGSLGCSSVKYGLQNGLRSIMYPADSIIRSNQFIVQWPVKQERWKRVNQIIRDHARCINTEDDKCSICLNHDG